MEKHDPNMRYSRGLKKIPTQSQGKDCYCNGCVKLDTCDWLKGTFQPEERYNFIPVEVRLKNNHKDFYKAIPEIHLEQGDIVAVESNPGHDIGIVTLVGEVVRLQMKRKKVSFQAEDIKKVYRRAKITDIEKWIQAINREEQAMVDTKKIVSDLNLDMKLNDIEFQGDNTKAIFYYTAADRVDFRELIKVLAEKFRIRIEMKQIGARQEAAKLGSIGSCGRELCCSTWISHFRSVNTSFARNQQLSLNPQKLTGPCSKLKCCLSYENDAYLEALREFPSQEVKLKTKKGDALFQKADVFKRTSWYSYASDSNSMMALPVDKVWEIITMNKKGNMPDQIEDFAVKQAQKNVFGVEMDENELKKMNDDYYYV